MFNNIDPAVLDRYLKIRAHAERGEGNERAAAQRMMEKMERENPGLRSHVDAQQRGPAGGGRRGPSADEWASAASQAADFINSVFRDIQRESEKARARQAEEDDDDEDADTEELIDELVDITTTIAKTGKITVKVEISSAHVEELLETIDDPDDLWEVLQGVGARVATELADALDPDEDDED
jgi:hypothetical protein